MKKLLFIFNPFAGKGLIRVKLSAVLEVFAAHGYLTTAWVTTGKADATTAALLGARYDRVICSGGDGTLSEVVAGLLTLKKRPILGYIPMGSTNDFAQNLNLPRGIEKLAETACAGLARPCDMGRFNEKTFVYVAAFGAFTDLSYDTPQELKNKLGHLAYWLEGLSRLGNLKSYSLSITHDGEEMTGDYVFGMVSNTVSVGGFQSLSNAGVQLDDGLFEVVLVRTPTNPMELQGIFTALARRKVASSGEIVAFRAARITITAAEPIAWTLDGEYGGSTETVDIENLHQAIALAQGK